MEMKIKSKRAAFTLVELLLAVTMITAILSMVYGSYFAASQSAERYREKISASRKARELIENLTCRIKGSCIPRPDENIYNSKSPGKSALANFAETSDSNNYFYGGCEEGNKEILHLVTANVSPSVRGGPLYEFTYRFQETAGRLLINKRKFYSQNREPLDETNWQVAADNLEKIRISFLDDEDWVSRWNFSEQKSLPDAVKIEIAVTGSPGQRYCYQTVAAPETQKTYRDTVD